MLNRLRTIAACAAAVVIAGCGGGGDDQADYTVNSGAAQKGPLAQGSAVFVNELTAATLQPNGKEYTFRTSNNLGAFSTAGIKFTSNYLSTMAWGYYFDEITGKQSTDVVALAGLSDISAGADTAINVNALSSMAVNRITKLATQTSPLTFTATRAQAQKDVLGAFYIYNGAAILTGTTINNVAQPANLTALDLSKNRAGDQMLAALSGVVMKAGANGNGVNTLLSQIAVDLGDDGLLNNSTNYTPSVSMQLCAAADVANFAAIATNLNKLYGTNYKATDLSQWVDSSGCVDQVIDKFKFSGTTVAVGTESKSPAYIAGPDDVGQCFSVGGVTEGSIGKLYYKGATTAVVGAQKVVLGDSMTIGLSASAGGSFGGFIQRSAPAANGTCPTTVPTSGLVRVQKYMPVAGYTVGGSVKGLATGQSLTLMNTGANARKVTTNGAFTFTKPAVLGTAYAVTISEQPAGQICNVTNGNGKSTDKITNVGVACRDIAYTVSTLFPNKNLGFVNSFRGIAIDAAGNFFVPQGISYQRSAIFKITPQGVSSVFADWYMGLPDPQGIAADAAGNIYFTSKAMVSGISPLGSFFGVAGTGDAGSADGAGNFAQFRSPNGVAVDSIGNLYIADTQDHKIRKITPDRFVSTLAGTGDNGYLDGGSNTAKFSYPFGIAVDATGNVYVTDMGNSRIRKISPQGIVSTIATLSNPAYYIAIDFTGSIVFSTNTQVSRLESGGSATTLAGSERSGTGDGVGISAGFHNIEGLAVDGFGNIFVLDHGNGLRIRKLTLQ